MADNWPYIGEPHVKSIRGYKGLWELREQFGRNRVRLFFFQSSANELVVVHGVVKQTERLPKRDIETAYRRMFKLVSDDCQEN